MKFTREERENLKQLVLDCGAFRFSDAESVSYIARHLGKPITRQYLWMMRKQLESDAAAQEWMNHFAKIGFVNAHKHRYDEIERVSKDAMNLLLMEKMHPIQAQDKYLMLAAIQTIVRCNKRLTELGLGVEVVDEMRKLIENGPPRQLVKQG